MSTLINGNAYGWSHISISFLGTSPAGVTSIKYEGKQDKRNNYGRGVEPVSRGRGNKEYSGSIKLEQLEVERIYASLPKGKDLMDVAPFDIVVTFTENGTLLRTHKLMGCEFTNDPFESASGTPNNEQELGLVIAKIIKE